MPQEMFTLYRVIGTMAVAGNDPGSGQSVNYSFDLDYRNAQQNGGLPEIVGTPVVTSFGPLGEFQIQGRGVELDNLIRFQSSVAEIDVNFAALRTTPPPVAPPPQVSGSQLFLCISPNEPCSWFPRAGVNTLGTASAAVYEYQTPDLPVPYIGPVSIR
jgi:hypothetical protein